MNKFDPQKLTTEFSDVTKVSPIITRRYTLTHSDFTGELFLYIAPEFAYERLNSNRDEVLGEWILSNEKYFYNVYLYVNGYNDPEKTAIRDVIFRRELPLALSAIKYGDKIFFETHNNLNTSPIIVYFISHNLKYNKIENWGTFSDY